MADKKGGLRKMVSSIRIAVCPRRSWAQCAALAIAILLVTSCGGEQGRTDGPADPAAEGTPGGTGNTICAAAQEGPGEPDATLAVIVVDHTASARPGLTDPPNLSAAIANLQTRGVEEKTGSQLQTLAVTASGQFPTISAPLSLDLKPGDTSPNADNLRKKVLRDCVPEFLKGTGPQPSAGDTDVIGALLAARQQAPSEIFVISSGLNSTTQANLTAPYDPAQLSGAVKDAIPDFKEWTIPVTWFDLGEPAEPLSAPDRNRVIAFWKDLLGDKLTVDTRE